jgi:hypothetical protein
MAKRRYSYTSKTRRGRQRDAGIAAQSNVPDPSGFVVFRTPYRRLVFSAGLTCILLAVIAAAVGSA